MRINIKDMYNLGHYAGEVGIEIEIEGKNLPLGGEMPGWRIDNDSSLKTDEAFEYVTKGGLSFDDARNEIIRFNNLFNGKDSKAEIWENTRAGVHIHVNMQEFTHSEVATFACLYYIFENVLVNWCGENRVGNLFCLRTDDATNVKDHLAVAIYNRNLRHLADDAIRYTAMNWKPLTQYGSLEFRSMQTPKDLTKINDWLNFLECLKIAAKKYDSPGDLIADYSMNTETDFLAEVFGEFAEELEDCCDDVVDLIKRGMWNAQDIVFMTDWEKFERNLRPLPLNNQVRRQRQINLGFHEGQRARH